MRFSFECTQWQKDRVFEVLDKLGFVGRYGDFNNFVSLRDCSDEEAPRLFAMCLELKQQGLITEFSVIWPVRKGRS